MSENVVRIRHLLGQSKLLIEETIPDGLIQKIAGEFVVKRIPSSNNTRFLRTNGYTLCGLPHISRASKLQNFFFIVQKTWKHASKCVYILDYYIYLSPFLSQGIDSHVS